MTNSTPDIPILDDDAVTRLEAVMTSGDSQAMYEAANIDNVRALCQTVRALRAEKAEQRGLTLISALINFVDWLHANDLLSVDDDRERAQLVLRFFDAHSKGENYFMQAEQIMEILGQPFQEQEAKQS